MSTIQHNAKAQARTERRALIDRTRESLALSSDEREGWASLFAFAKGCAVVAVALGWVLGVSWVMSALVFG